MSSTEVKNSIKSLIILIAIISFNFIFVNYNSIAEYALPNQQQEQYNEIELIDKTSFIEKFTDTSKKYLKDNSYFSSKNLIVIAKENDFNNYSANSIKIDDNIFLLSYETEEACKEAYSRIIKDEKVISVEVDSVLKVEESEESQNNHTSDNKIEIIETELSKYLNSLEAQKEVKVAILDTGISKDHNFQNEVINTGINLSDENDIYDNNGHGTEMAEIISSNCSIAKIIPIKIADKEGESTVLKTYMGIKAAMENGADIINISMNTYKTTTSQILTDIINEATEKGIIVVTSSGNNKIDTKYITPSNIESAIVVGAIKEDNTIAKYSNYGETVDYTSYGKHNDKEGTSYAAANVTGIIANVLTKNQDISILDDYAVDLGAKRKDIYYGQGFLGMRMNKNSEDIIPEDHFENTIFDVDWKNLDDEKLNEYLEKAEEAHVAIFIQNLSKEDLELILSKNTILTNDYIKYDYVLDENGNKVVDEIQTEEDGTEDIKYKIEEKERMPYYEYLLNLDFSSMTISAFATRNGYYTLQIQGGGKSNSSIRIKTALASTDKTRSQNVTYSIVGANTTNNHGFTLASTSGTTKKATGSQSGSDGTSDVVNGTRVYRTKTYIAMEVKGKYSQPAYTYPVGSRISSDTGTRINFHKYNWQNSGANTVSPIGVYTSVQTQDVTMSVHTVNAGHTEEGHHGILRIQFNYPTLNINYNANGGSGSISAGSVAYNGAYTTKANTFARTGYHASSGSEWGTSASGGTKFSANKAYAANTLKSFTNGARFSNQSITLYAQWLANTYKVVYNGNGHTGGSTASSSHTYDQAKALTGNSFTRSHTVTFNHNYSGTTNTTKTATYSFKNWNTAANGSGTAYGNSASVKNLTATNGGTVNLYAQWTSSSVTYAPTRTGYAFGGWYTTSACTGNRVDNNGTYTPTTGITLYAKWIPNTYTVVYNGNGATGGSTANSVHTYDQAKALTPNGFERKYIVTYNHNYTGSTNESKTATYGFINWNTASGGTGKAYSDKTSIINLLTSGTYNLYAQWASNSVTYIPIRTGYTFEGWYATSDCAGSRVDDSGIYTPTENTTLYAKWKINNYNYTVKYLEKETNKVLHDPKVDGSKVYGTQILSSNEIIDIDGYNYDSSNDIYITEIEENNIINIYYTKRIDLTYTVNYLEKDDDEDNSNNRVLHEPKLVENQRFEDIINSTDEVIDIDGFWFDSPDNETMQITTGENIINLYYTKRTDLSYTVNYLEKENDQDIVLHEQKVVENQTFEDIIISSNEIIDISGYDFERVDKDELQITTGENIINVYYKKGKFEYRVEYYYDNEIEESKTVRTIATFKDIISEYEDKNIPGYKLEKVEGLPLKVTEYPAINIIKIYYIKDNFHYIVEYYYNKVKDGTKTESYIATFKDVIDSYKDKVIDGYELEKIQNFPLVLTEDVEKNIINVYYKYKESQIEIKYKDRHTGEEISEQITKTGKVGSKYDISADRKQIGGYTLVEEPDNLEVEFQETSQEKVYYYAKNTNVIVKYLEKDETNKVLADEEIIEGYEGKQYNVQPKEIENYTFVESTSNLTGTMSRDGNEVICYYLQNTKVTVNYIDRKTGEKLEIVTKEGLVGDTYTSIGKDFEGYILEERPQQETVIMLKEEIILNYYYIKISAGVIEKHIDINTNKILDSKVYEGNEGDEYKTAPKEFEGYDLVEDKYPENHEGMMDRDLIEVKYYYVRKITVKIEYIDKITGFKIPEIIEKTDENGKIEYEEKDSTETIDGHEGDSYETVEKHFKDYVIEKSMYPENAKGTMTVTVNEDGTLNTEILVRYYYAHTSGGVLERHLDINTNQLLEDETRHEGHEGDSYKTLPKEFEGYDLVRERYPENGEGNMTKEEIIVNYYYVRKAKVIVEYLDKYTKEKLIELVEIEDSETEEKTYKEEDSTEIIEGHEGDKYETRVKAFDRYRLVEKPENAEGEMTVTVGEDGKVDETTYVRYYYVYVSKGVREEHIDAETGNGIIAPIEHKGYEGDKYKTAPKSFEGYELVKEYYPENSEGTMTREEIVVKYYYKKINNNINIDNGDFNGNGTGTPPVNDKDSNNGNQNYNSNNNTYNNNNKNYNNGSSSTNNNKSQNNNATNNSKVQNNNKQSQDINNGKTPNTGDILPVVAIITVVGVIVFNIVICIIHKKRKDFIK